MADIRSFFKSSVTRGTEGPAKKTPYKKPSTENSGSHGRSEENEPKQGVKWSKKKQNSDESGERMKKSKKTKRILIESDSDEEPLPQPLRKAKKYSEEDHCVTAKKKIDKGSKVHNNQHNNSAATTADSQVKRQSPEQRKKTTQELRPVDVNDFFGATPDKNIKENQVMKKKKIESGISSPSKKKKIESSVSSPSKKNSSSSTHQIDNTLKTHVEDSVQRHKMQPEQTPTKRKKQKHHTRNSEEDKMFVNKVKDSQGSSNFASLQSLVLKSDKIAETPQPSERKKGYWEYKQREGPKALGSKELPSVEENCLQGLTFVITGVLESFEREEFVDCIQRHGGKVTTSVSGRTTYLITGRDPGQTKLDKAAKHKTKQLDEDGFIELLQSKSHENKSHASTSSCKQVYSPSKAKEDSNFAKSTSLKAKTPPMMKPDSHHSQYSRAALSPQRTVSSTISTQESKSLPDGATKYSSMLWVDKYKPKTMKNIVGQQGEKSNANKLKKWLINWKSNNNSSKSKRNYFAGKEDGSIFKAALLSGPPGVGKTTTATLVCKEVGVEFTEMNASDTRGRKALDTIIKESLSNTSVTGMLQGNREEASNHVLIMDEVDGMAGNEDRGGMQELIQLIKKSKIPIICMCNDRNSPKVRSLANYCFDLRFYKPRVEQIKGFALSVAAKESLKIPPQAMEQIVIGTNQDIRQVLHNLQMWTSTSNQLSYDEAKQNANQACKNIKLGPFDIVKQLFTHSDASKMSINQKTDLFFTDYSFIPLFIQENYPNVNPAAARGNIHTTLELLSATADAIADGNLIEKSVRSQQAWSLLPLQGYFSTVLPSNKMAGYIGQRIEFPQWLGKNSSRGKNDRILQELKLHMAVSSNCMKTDLNLDYVPTLKKRLSEPLLKNNGNIINAVKDVILIMDVYDLNRQDWESIIDVGKFGKESDVVSEIPTKVKSAFTRMYNKESHMVPYSVQDAAKRTKSAPPLDEEVFDEEKEGDLDNDVNEDDDDITKDAMIKFNSKSKTSSSRSSTKKNPNTKIKENTSKKKNSKTKK